MKFLRYVAIAGSMVLIGGVLNVNGQGLYQVETRPVRGFMPNMDQLSSPVDHIDPVSRKVHIDIPLASLPKARGGTGFDLNLVYDTHAWNLNPGMIAAPPPYQPLQVPGWELSPEIVGRGGWALNIDLLGLDYEEKEFEAPNQPPCGTDPVAQYRLRVRLLDGSLHVMHLKGFEDPNYIPDGFFKADPSGRARCYFQDGTVGFQTLASGWLTYYSTDGSYLKLEIFADGSGNWANQTWYLYFPDGRRVEGGPQGLQLFDANENRIRVTTDCYDPPPGNCEQTFKAIEDDAGHQIRISETGLFWDNLTTTISADGPNGPMVWTLNWEPFELGQDQRRYLLTETLQVWDTSVPLDQVVLGLKYVQLPLSTPVPASQAPPIWNSYAFGYSDDSDDGFGEINLVRTPSGATFNYRYTLEQPWPVITSKMITHQNLVSERKLIAPGLPDLVWSYGGSAEAGSTDVVNPDLSHTVYWIKPSGSYLDSSIVDNTNVGPVIYRIDEPNGSIRKRVWSQNRVTPGSSTINPYFIQNAWVKKETVTVGNAAGIPTLTAVTAKTIDKNGNLLETMEYASVAYTPAGPENGGAVERTTHFTYHAETPDYTDTSGHPKAYSSIHFSPLSPTQPRRLEALRRKEVRNDAGAIVAVNEFEYDDPYRSGNLEVEKRWDNVKSPTPPSLGGLTSGNAQVLTREYGLYGNLSDIYAPEVRTHITYESTGSFPTRIDYAYQTSNQRSWAYDWDADSGTLKSKTDLDNNIMTEYGYDPVGRPETVIEAGMRKTFTDYDDPNRKIIVMKDLRALNLLELVTTTEYDALGRIILTHTVEPGNPNGINVRSFYDTAGNRTVQSSPYRTSSDNTLEWTCTQKDSLSRVIAVAIFKGSSAPIDCASANNRTGVETTVYDANSSGSLITVTDPAGRARREVRDALGRLIEVIEDPSGSLNYSTTYQYNTLDKLTGVTQGIQGRTFAYSSLGRLTSAQNPETGTIAYSYSDAGDLLTRTHILSSLVTTFSYDDMHRILTKNYSDGTPDVTYEYYTSGSPNIGQLKSVSSSAASNQNDSYDALGRVTASSHTITGDSTTRTFSYTYWLNNSARTVTNPSGRVINFDVDDAGRAAKVWSGSTTYADLTAASVPYIADGRMAQVKLGNNLWETRVYQTPGTSTLFKVGTTAGGNDRLELEYNFDGTANNGNLINQKIRQPGREWTQTFAYDGVNRLSTATETGGWSQTFGYDRYGNQWVTSTGLQWSDPHVPSVSTNFNSSNNRINVNLADFDAAGNQTHYAPWDLAYDAENRNVTVSSSSSGNGTFDYDGDGRRVKKTWTPYGGQATSTYYLYNALGQLAAEYSTATSTASTSYAHTDLLGSTRMVTNASGAVLECYDYLPFGRMLSDGDNGRNTGCYPPNPTAQINSKLPQKFTGKERDAETRLDYFGARYLSAAQGRWMTPDWSETPTPVPYASLSDPQTLNLYAYVRNNPLNKIDKDGHCIFGLDTLVCVAAAAVAVELTAFKAADVYYKNEKIYWDAKSLRMQKLELIDSVLKGDVENVDLKRELTQKNELQLHKDLLNAGSETLGLLGKVGQAPGAPRVGISGSAPTPLGSAFGPNVQLGADVEKAIGIGVEKGNSVLKSIADQAKAREELESSAGKKKKEREAIGMPPK